MPNSGRLLPSPCKTGRVNWWSLYQSTQKRSTRSRERNSCGNLHLRYIVVVRSTMLIDFPNSMLHTSGMKLKRCTGKWYRQSLVTIHVTPKILTNTRDGGAGGPGGLSPPSHPPTHTHTHTHTLFTRITFHFVLVWGTYEEIKKKKKKTRKVRFTTDYPPRWGWITCSVSWRLARGNRTGHASVFSGIVLQRFRIDE